MRRVTSVAVAFLVISISLFLAGCATYRYNHQTYHSPEEGLKAQANYLDEIKTKIKPATKKLGGSLLFVIPSFDTCVSLGVRRIGNPSKEAVDYTGNLMVNDLKLMGEFAQKRELFDSVEIVINKHPETYAKKNFDKYDAVIFLKITGPYKANWTLLAKPEYNEFDFRTDKTKQPGYERVISWLDTIENKLKTSNYKPTSS